MKKHLISLRDLSIEDITKMLTRGLEFCNKKAVPNNILKSKVIGIYFRKTSTRTRTAFSSAALQMGANIITYGPHDLQENTGESPGDTAKVLSGMLDGLVMRTAGEPAELKAYATQTHMGIINAMSMDEHPTQALADITTMMQHFGQINGLSVLYVGEGNNTASALALLLTRFAGTKLFLYTPPGYGLTMEASNTANRQSTAVGSVLREYHKMTDLPENIDVVYTSRWQTTGTFKKDENWREIFGPFTITEELMSRYPKAVFMHDLPANRGEDVAAAVLDGPSSIAFQQANNKMYSAMAVLEWSILG